MEPNRIKEILQKIEAGEPNQPLMPPLRQGSAGQATVNNQKIESDKDGAPNTLPKWKISLLALLAFLILVAIGYGLTLVYKNYKNVRSDDPRLVVESLGKLAELPLGESPTVSTITEIESLKNQPFFKDAQVGDKVVVFNTAKKAYIYRPTTGKLIGVAPLSK